MVLAYWSVFSVGIILSLSLSIYASVHHPVAGFYLLPTRVWELLLGGLLSFVLIKRGGCLGLYKSPQILSACGLGMIIFSIFYFDGSYPWPSQFTMMPCLGAVLLIAAVTTHDPYF